jgi:hypothetical protein
MTADDNVRKVGAQLSFNRGSIRFVANQLDPNGIGQPNELERQHATAGGQAQQKLLGRKLGEVAVGRQTESQFHKAARLLPVVRLELLLFLGA